MLYFQFMGIAEVVGDILVKVGVCIPTNCGEKILMSMNGSENRHIDKLDTCATLGYL